MEISTPKPGKVILSVEISTPKPGPSSEYRPLYNRPQESLEVTEKVQESLDVDHCGLKTGENQELA